MRYRTVQDGVAWGRTDRYVTQTGELLTVWSPSTPEVAVAYAGVMYAIKAAAWESHYGVTVPEPTPEKACQGVETHMGKNGSFGLAWIGGMAIEEAEVIGYIKHRPIYSETAKREAVASTRSLGRPTPIAAYVHNIDVAPSAQQAGVGSALLESALSHYPVWVSLRLDATGERGYTHEWFEKLGGEPNLSLEISPVLGLTQVRYDTPTVSVALSRLQGRVAA
jgi:ribosomal protein S18 acetylase RimI-like enzyme